MFNERCITKKQFEDKNSRSVLSTKAIIQLGGKLFIDIYSMIWIKWKTQIKVFVNVTSKIENLFVITFQYAFAWMIKSQLQKTSMIKIVINRDLATFSQFHNSCRFVLS